MNISRRKFMAGVAVCALPLPSPLPEPYIQTGFTACEPISFGSGMTETQTVAYYARLKAYAEELTANGVWSKIDALYIHASEE
jgi:hypothetical protein